MWIKINEKRWLNMDNLLDIDVTGKTIYLQGLTPDMYTQSPTDSPEAKAILKWLEEQE
jgi:hypothetical protein